jgi:hypothetical protein
MLRRTLLGTALAVSAGTAWGQGRQLAIATGTTGGVYYPLGGGMANILSRAIPGLSATVEVTGGSVANNQLLAAGRVGLIFTQVDAAVDAAAGRPPFRGQSPIRALMVLYTNRMQVVTTAASGIRTMADLRGKRVSTGAPGSATEVMAFRLIAAAGLDRERDFRARERLSPAESTNAIKDGKLDAYFFVSGIPTSAITDLGATPGTRLVLIDHDEFLPRMIQEHGPVYFPEVIPAGTYPGQDTPNRQVSVANILAVRADMPDAEAEQLVRTLWEARSEIATVHAEGRNIALPLQRSAAAGVPWHPAAERFWRAAGATL